MSNAEMKCVAWRASRAAMLRRARRCLPVGAAECAAQIGRSVGDNAVDRQIARNALARAALRGVA